MENKARFDLIARHTEEILTDTDLLRYIEEGIPLKHYIGFEISGKVHLGTGLMCMGKVKDFLDAGADCSIFLADWHSWINDKLGGDRQVIRNIALGYFKEALIASLKCMGGDDSKIRWVLGTDLYHNNDEYWAAMIDVSKNTTLKRMQRSITILGRKEQGSVDFAKLIYPPMQVADIFMQGINMPHAGLDQRKAQVIAREVAPKMKVCPLKDTEGTKIKPAAVHHHLLLGLGKPPVWPVPKENLQDLWASLKMSKSKPDTCVFVHDSPEEIERKISKAFCPEREIEFNPIMDWAKYIVFREPTTFTVKRPRRFGGNLEFRSYDELAKAYLKGDLHPMDLKTAIAEWLIGFLRPAREHFKKPEKKAALEELENLAITR